MESSWSSEADSQVMGNETGSYRWPPSGLVEAFVDWCAPPALLLAMVLIWLAGDSPKSVAGLGTLFPLIELRPVSFSPVGRRQQLPRPRMLWSAAKG